MVEPYITSSIIDGSLFGLMAIGLTLTYLTTKVPNFAYGSFVTIGMYTSFSMQRLYHINPYGSVWIAFLLAGLVSVFMYLSVLRVLARRGASLVALMIATLAVDIAFVGVFGIYADYLSSTYGIIDSRQFFTLQSDFTLYGLPGLVFSGPLALAIVTLGLFLLLTQTKFGVAMRASVENPSLARILGINTEKVYIFAWFLAGAFAGLSGSFYVLALKGATDEGSKLIVEIFSASVLGGLSSIYGAALGGVIIGGSEVIVTTILVFSLGPQVAIYQKGIPLLIMIITLMVLPQGLASLFPSVRTFYRLPETFRNIIMKFRKLCP